MFSRAAFIQPLPDVQVADGPFPGRLPRGGKAGGAGVGRVIPSGACERAPTRVASHGGMRPHWG
eukprot:scaffold406_cov391-Prasinococcus_capsulatus_cf.AAC.8